MPRMHNGENSSAKWPWNCPEETRELYRDCLLFRYRFIPTVYSYAIHGSRTGEPIIRPLFYDHAEDTRLYAIDDEFYLGEHLLVAPVTEANVTGRDVYLPEGTWVHLWSKLRIEGDKTILADAPLFKKEGLPIFVKVGGGVAYQPECLSLRECVPEKLSIELYADDSAHLTLHESESVTNTFSCEKKEDGFEISAENKSDIQREYEVTVYYADRKALSTTLKAPAGKTATARVKFA